MVIVVAAVIVVAFILFLLTCFCKDISCLLTVGRRMLKELLLALILFNCFNFSYSAGLHFAYADPADSLFIWGTLAAVGSLVVPVLMVGVLQCS